MIGILRKERTLSIMPTYQCNAECTNCGTFSNPRVKEKLSQEEVFKAIKEAKNLDFLNVVFTGGEPTLSWGDLLASITYARELGLHTRIVTNAYWAKSYKSAIDKLNKLIDAGLDEINYSTGDEHSKFIPLSRICYAVKAAYDLGLGFHVNIEGSDNNKIRKIDLINNILLAEIPNDVLVQKFDESPWMPLSPDQKGIYPEDWYVNKKNIDSRTGCNSVLQTIVLQANGKIGACCGLGLKQIEELNVGYIGSKNPLENSIRESEADMLLLLIHYIGPEKILAWAQNYDSSIEWEDMYAHRCQACKRIYSDGDIAAVLKENISDLEPELISSIAIDEFAWRSYAKKCSA